MSMRVTPIHETHTVHTSKEDVRATIDAENLSVVLSTLSNLYSDPVYAVVREYSTNALDSHVAAGNDMAIEVSLPKDGSQPELVIRDYGVGLDIDELRKTYLSYGASTKRDSDDFNGTLGLGSKSGLTYAPLGFQVAAVKDGHKILAVVAQDGDGIGVLRILGEYDTDEANGVTITIPVQAKDVYAFEVAAEKLFRAWKPGTVLVDGEEPSTYHDDEDLIWIDPDVAVGRNHHSVIVMGNVPYRFNRQSDWGYGIVAYVPMGSVHFTPSREDLHYTTHTEATLDTLLDFVNKRAEQGIVEAISNAATPWAAVKLATDTRRALHQSTVQRRFDRLVAPLLPARTSALPRNGYRWHPGRRGGVNTFTVFYAHTVRHEAEAVILDYPSKAQTISASHKARLNRFLNDNGHSVTLIPDGTNEIEFLDGRPNVYYWDDVVAATPTVRSPRGKAVTTTYDTYQAGSYVDALAEFDPADGPILYQHYDRYNQLTYKSGLLPEAQIVELKANQVDKFVRNNPTAKSYGEYYHEAQKEAKAALTLIDALAAHAGEYGEFKAIADKVTDPELRSVLKMIGSEPSPAAKRANALSVGQPERPALIGTIHDRYPLLDHVDSWALRSKGEVLLDELVVYIEARWAQVQAEQAVAEEAEAIANAEVES